MDLSSRIMVALGDHWLFVIAAVVIFLIVIFGTKKIK